MFLIGTLVTVLLLAPPVVIGAFWWTSMRPARRRAKRLPDSAAIIFVRLGCVVCAMLPIVQIFEGIVRYRLGEMGSYLWFVVPGMGLLLALFALSGLLAYARGYERTVSSGMLLLSVGMLLLLTFLGTSA